MKPRERVLQKKRRSSELTMANIGGFNPTVFLTGKLNAINDAVAGGSASAGTGAALYASQLGARINLSDAQIAALTYTTTGTLYGGIYQYVNFLSSATASPIKGLIAFWSTDATFIVTNDEPTGVADWAGIGLNTVTKGNFGWIQTAGKATIKFRAAITKATPAIGDLVICAAAGAGADVATADVLADATALLSTTVRRVLGNAIAAPVSGTLTTVRLWPRSPLFS